MAFIPGPTASRTSGGTEVFCPGWRHQSGQKDPLLSRLVAPPGIKGPTLLSRLVTPTRTKGPFCPGWCYQPGQKASPRDSSKGSYSLLSHMYYLDELVRKPCTRQEVLGLNPAGCKKFFSMWDILSRFYHPGQKPPAFCPGRRIPVPKLGQMALWNQDKMLFL